MNAADELLQSALGHHLEGRLPDAEALYRQVLAGDPWHPHALSMLGMLLMDGPGKAEAESLFLRHLETEPGNALTQHNLGRLLQDRGNDSEAIALFRRAAQGKPDFAPIFVDLAASLHRLGFWDEALEALDRALAIDPHFGAAHDQRGLVLYDCRRFGQAAEAHLSALSCTSVDAALERIPVLLHLAKAAYGAAELELAERACRAIFALDADNEGALDHLVIVLNRLRRDDEVRSLLNRLARTHGLVTTAQPEHPVASILLLGGVGGVHVPTPYIFDPTQFATTVLTLVSPDQPDAPLGAVRYEDLAGVDLVFNTLGDAERDGGQLEPVQALAARLGKPLLNSPDRVARTGRDQSRALYGDIPGLIVPGVRRMTRDELARLSVFAAPFLVRPCGVHGGEDLVLIETPSALAEYLDRVPFERFLQIDFHDFKGARNSYRKYRFIFVDRQPFPYHLAIAETWMVHYWRARMGRDDWKKREEEDFLTDWRQVFGPAAAAIVEQVGQRMDLDYGGMDCSLLPNGEVLLFEANACMLVRLDESEANFPYKHRAVPRIRDAVTRMLRNRVSRPRESS
ncbi:tetratricopeptide repeat protein [mine drainage metagenome]|uniref:Tetratricopeptide repeat protein n=1 Tax=mine drainage metagenome TaxID=410659 RepID=A0A1J5R2K8_9ZZZZ